MFLPNLFLEVSQILHSFLIRSIGEKKISFAVYNGITPVFIFSNAEGLQVSRFAKANFFHAEAMQKDTLSEQQQYVQFVSDKYQQAFNLPYWYGCIKITDYTFSVVGLTEDVSQELLQQISTVFQRLKDEISVL